MTIERNDFLDWNNQKKLVLRSGLNTVLEVSADNGAAIVFLDVKNGNKSLYMSLRRDEAIALRDVLDTLLEAQ